MADPTVSVVVPTFRRPEKLRRTVDSICNQTVTDWELIVVNDDPVTDVDHVLPNDIRIRYHQHPHNRGAPAARNTGIELAAGEYIALIDDDDAWKPEKLARQLARFEALDESYGMVYTGREIVRDGEVVESYHATTSGWIFENLLNGNVIPSETPLIRQECFGEVGKFDPSFESVQDLDMWLRIARAYQIDAIEEPLAIAYRGHEDRISDNPDRKYAGLMRLLDKYDDDFAAHPNILAQRRKTLGVYALNGNRPRDARRALVKSFSVDRADPLTIIYLLLTLFPEMFRIPILSLRRTIIVYGLSEGIRRWLTKEKK